MPAQPEWEWNLLGEISKHKDKAASLSRSLAAQSNIDPAVAAARRRIIAEERAIVARLDLDLRKKRYAAQQSRRRRNPETAELGAAYTRMLTKATAAHARGDKKAAQRWETSLKKLDRYIDPPDPTGHEFYTVHGHPVPIRYSLQSANRYHQYKLDHAGHVKRAEQDEQRYEGLRHERAAHRKRSYSPERAKADRERRKTTVSVSPTASRRDREAAARKAEREGKSLVTRARRSGGNVNRDWFAQRYGDQSYGR